MLRKFTTLAMGLFLLVFIVFVLWVNMNRPRILVLHSYSENYVWTREINVGLRRVLDQQSWVDVRFHEMKTKTRSDEDFLRRAGIAARNAIDLNTPQVLIAVDDYAQKLAAKFYTDDPAMQIVFAGINGGVEPYGYDKANNVTGILERKPAGALRDVVKLINDNRYTTKFYQPRAMFLGDTSHSVERDAAYLDTYDWEPVVYLGLKAVGKYEEWQKAVREMRGQADYLLVGGYRKLKRNGEDKSFVPAEEVMTWTEANSPVPVIGMNIFNTEEGAMLSVGVSAFEQGEVAASMAMDIITNGKAATDIPVQTSSQYVISLRRSAMDARGVKVPDIFEAFARATANYYD